MPDLTTNDLPTDNLPTDECLAMGELAMGELATDEPLVDAVYRITQSAATEPSEVREAARQCAAVAAAHLAAHEHCARWLATRGEAS